MTAHQLGRDDEIQCVTQRAALDRVWWVVVRSDGTRRLRCQVGEWKIVKPQPSRQQERASDALNLAKDLAGAHIDTHPGRFACNQTHRVVCTSVCRVGEVRRRVVVLNGLRDLDADNPDFGPWEGWPPLEGGKGH